MDPVWDDVVYLVDGQKRLTILDRDGLGRFIFNMWHNPPHSPWSTTLALLGFLIFGLNAWAPYVMNFMLILAFLLIGNSFISDQNSRNRLFILSTILVLPLTLRAVHDFRPDIALGLGTAFFCLSALRVSIFPTKDENRITPCVLLGVLGGVTLLIKPSFLLHSVALFCLSIGLAELLSLVTRASNQPLRARAMEWLYFVLSLLAVCGPYYVRSLRTIVGYITQSTGSGRYASIWKAPGGWRGALERTLREDTGWMVGPSIYLFDVVIVIGIIWFITQKDWRGLAFIFAGLICAAASIAVVVYSQIASPFFGLTWQIIVALLAIYCAGRLSASFRFAPAAFFVSVIWMLFLNGPGNIGWSRVEDMLNGKSMNQAVIDRIKAAVPQPIGSKKPALIVYVGFIGAVNSGSQEWIGRAERLMLIFPGLDFVGGLDEQYAAARKADVVELAAPESRWLNRGMPTSELQQSLLEKMRETLDFVELAPVAGKEGRVYIFVRKALMQEARASVAIDQ